MLMQPNNDNPDDYSFILDTPPPQSKPKPAEALKRLSWKGKLILAVVGLFLVFIVGLVVSAIASNQGEKATIALVTVASRQADIISSASHVAKISPKNSRAQVFASTTQRTLEADQKQYLIAVSSLGIKAPATSKDDIFIEAMKNAKLANTLNDSFRQEMLKKLNSYLRLLESTYDQTESAIIKQALSDSYDHVEALVNSQEAAEVQPDDTAESAAPEDDTTPEPTGQEEPVTQTEADPDAPTFTVPQD